eukprot:4302086-Amphidinium_carterae.1
MAGYPAAHAGVDKGVPLVEHAHRQLHTHHLWVVSSVSSKRCFLVLGGWQGHCRCMGGCLACTGRHKSVLATVWAIVTRVMRARFVMRRGSLQRRCAQGVALVRIIPWLYQCHVQVPILDYVSQARKFYASRVQIAVDTASQQYKQ